MQYINDRTISISSMSHLSRKKRCRPPCHMTWNGVCRHFWNMASVLEVYQDMESSLDYIKKSSAKFIVIWLMCLRIVYAPRIKCVDAGCNSFEMVNTQTNTSIRMFAGNAVPWPFCKSFGPLLFGPVLCKGNVTLTEHISSQHACIHLVRSKWFSSQ